MSAEAKTMVHQERQLPQENKMVVTSEQMTLARQTVAKDLDDNQFALFCYNCTRLGVHPLDGLLVPIVRKDGEVMRLTFVNTVDLLRSRAAETGDYAGSDDPRFAYEMKDDANLPSDAQVTVWKFVQGEKCAFSATARWEEYYPGEGKQGFMWRNKPHVMLGKCAEALALRKAFPKQLSGLYISEELQKEIESPVGRASAKQPQKQPPKPVGDVMCGECRAVNGHLPSCKYRKPQEAQVEGKHVQEGEIAKKPETMKWLVQVEAVDERERIIKDDKGKEKSRTKYLMLTCFNAANENVTIYCWHTGEMKERLLAIELKTKCIFMVKAAKTGDKTYYNVEEIVEITGEKPRQEPGPEPPEEN